MSPNDFITVDDHSLIGPYVVDALTSEERAAFEVHLAACARCRGEVAEFTESLADVSGVLAVPPPPVLRAAVLSAIAGVPQEPAVPREIAVAAEPAGPPQLSVVPGSGKSEWDWKVEAAQDELALRRNRRATRALALAVAAVAVLALGLGGWVVNLSQQRQQQVAAQQVAQQRAQQEQQRYTDLLAAPDAKVYTEDKGDARYSFVVSKSRNEALFLGTNLPDPGAGNSYRLWTVASAPLMDNAVTGSGSVRQWFRGPVDDSSNLAVNIEPTAGSPVANTPSTDILSIVKS